MSGGSSERVARATGQSEARAGVAGWGAVASPGAAAVEGRLRGGGDFLPARPGEAARVGVSVVGWPSFGSRARARCHGWRRRRGGSSSFV